MVARSDQPTRQREIERVLVGIGRDALPKGVESSFAVACGKGEVGEV